MRGESHHFHVTSNKVSTTSLRNENQSERKTVQAAGQRGPNGGLGQLLNTQAVILLTVPSGPIKGETGGAVPTEEGRYLQDGGPLEG